jgi:hypothetical protein
MTLQSRPVRHRMSGAAASRHTEDDDAGEWSRAVTIIVSVKINDGIVMAADSAGAMPSGQVYAHANKIANLREGPTLELFGAAY